MTGESPVMRRHGHKPVANQERGNQNEYEVLDDCGYNVTYCDLFKGRCYIEFNGDYLPTGRYFKLVSAVRTDEEESDEVIFFDT